MKNNNKDIKGTYLFKGEKSGKTVTIFSGIHGDEVSGIKATKKFIKNIESQNIKINSGTLIIVPECNTEAIKINKREKKYNLNRLFHDNIKGNSYEEKRSKELMEVLDNSDYLLDLHSTSEETKPFLFCEDNTIDLAKKIGASNLVYGWKNLDFGITYDSQTYIDNKGGIGFTFEAGSHLDKYAEDNAYNMILSFLNSLKIIDYPLKEYTKKQSIYEINNVYINKSGKFKYFVDTKNFTKVKKGYIIGLDGNTEIIADKDMVLIMPKSENIIKKGVEVFFEGNYLV